MARPRKSLHSDPFGDLAKKTEILEREMTAQRAAIERLQQLGQVRAHPLPIAIPRPTTPAKSRATR